MDLLLLSSQQKNSRDRLPSGCQCHSHVSLRVNADEQQGMKAEMHKRTLHTVKNIASALQWCSSHQRDADVDADVNMMCGKVALRFQQS